MFSQETTGRAIDLRLVKLIPSSAIFRRRPSLPTISLCASNPHSPHWNTPPERSTASVSPRRGHRLEVRASDFASTVMPHSPANGGCIHCRKRPRLKQVCLVVHRHRPVSLTEIIQLTNIHHLSTPLVKQSSRVLNKFVLGAVSIVYSLVVQCFQLTDSYQLRPVVAFEVR